MNNELYQMKTHYENLISKLNECYNKLEGSYSNLLLCKKNLLNVLKINENYFNNTTI